MDTSDRYAMHATNAEYGEREWLRRHTNDLMLPAMWALFSQPGGVTEPELYGHWRFSMFSHAQIREALGELKYPTACIRQEPPSYDIGPQGVEHWPWVAIADAQPDLGPFIGRKPWANAAEHNALRLSGVPRNPAEDYDYGDGE